MLGSYHPQDPINPRLGRAIVLDLLASAASMGLVARERDPVEHIQRDYQAGQTVTGIISRRGVPRETTVAAAAATVRWIAGRVGNCDIADQTWDDAAAHELLWDLYNVIDYGRRPVPLIAGLQTDNTGEMEYTTVNSPPKLSEHEADIQEELVRMAGLEDHRKRFDAAEMFIADRTFWDARADTLSLIEQAAQLIWTLVSFSEDPDGLLNQLTEEIASRGKEQ